MKLRTIFTFSAIFLTLALLSCASSTSQGAAPAYSEGSLTLDRAIDDAASYLIGRIPPGAEVAIVDFEAEAGGLSDYIFEELWNRFEGAGKFTMVDRRNLERIRTELDY